MTGRAEAAGLLVSVDVVLAVITDARSPGSGGWATVADGLTGLAFLAAAFVASGAERERWLMAAVGAAWFAGSWLPTVASLHQAVLVVALLAFPTGRLGTMAPRLVATLAVPVALGVDTQLGVAIVFGVVAAVIGGSGGRNTARWYPCAVATVCAATFVGFWVLGNHGALEPALATIVWQAVLVTAAAVFPLAVEATVHARARRAEAAMRMASSGGLDGLSAALAQALGVRQLRIVGWDRCCDADGGHRLVVHEGAEPIAVVLHDSDDLDDPITAEAVSRAVRLIVVNQRLLDEQRIQLVELEAARSRLLAAVDLARGRIAADVRREVAPAMAAAYREIDRTRAASAPGPRVELDVAANELAVLRTEITDLLGGMPLRELGCGRIGGALAALPQALPLPVDLNIDETAYASVEVETAIFYVCVEALTNSVKHAHATWTAITLETDDSGVDVRVADDGDGGADAEGFGLRGLRDRVEAVGGRLRVDSPIGSGTVVSARLPTVS